MLFWLSIFIYDSQNINLFFLIMNRIYTILVSLVYINVLSLEAYSQDVLSSDLLNSYISEFNRTDNELYQQYIPNKDAYLFLKENIPLFDCPDKNVERTYYFRWWTYRKHIKKTPYGFIITEFLPDVSWSANQNAITCPGLFHFLEGRWMKKDIYLKDYANFWLNHSGYHKNSNWSHFEAVLGHAFPLSDAILQFYKVHPDYTLLENSKEKLLKNFKKLESLRSTDTELYWSNAGGWEGDGMEVAVGGDGIRPTVNSYMYSQALALSKIYSILGEDKIAKKLHNKSKKIAKLVNELLWDKEAKFFKVLKIDNKKLVTSRELFGYVPWCYSIPPKNKGFEEAWKQVNDSKGFYAPYGLTTCEQRHKGFKVEYNGHECQWNGPSWPYATSQTLMAMANVLQEYPQDVISKKDYFSQFLIYTNSHKLQNEKGIIVPWIDENLDPYTGTWIARTLLSRKQNFNERGKDYNHSLYIDLLITGLLGLKPHIDNVIEINPCLPNNVWDYFCIQKIPYKKGDLTIIWDKKGTRYNMGVGFTIIYNEVVVYRGEQLERVICRIEKK